MRIVKYERIYLSQNESNTWEEFDIILTGIARETRNPNTEKEILKIQELLNNLLEKIEVEDIE